MVATSEPTSRNGQLLPWLPLPVLAVGIGVLAASQPWPPHEFPYLLAGLNIVFATAVSLFVAYLCARSFLVTAEPGLLLLGCGVLVWGLDSGVAALSRFLSGNTTVTIHNLGVLAFSACSLTGAVLTMSVPPRIRTPGPWLVAAYSAAVGVAALVVAVTFEGWLPVFFVQGAGGTPVREAVLWSAVGLLTLTTALLWRLNRRAPSAFLRWYAPGLAILAVGLAGVGLQTTLGGLLNWTSRGAQYLGGLYLLVAGIAAVRDARGWRISLAEELHASRKRYAMFAAATFEGIVESDAGRIVACNEQFARMTGRSVAELTGMAISELIVPEDRERVLANIDVNIESVIEHGLLRADGTRLVVEAHGRPAAPGTPHRFTAVRDITARKRAENETTRTAAQRQLALDAAHMGWWHYDAQTRVSHWDDRVREIFGVTGYERRVDEFMAEIVYPEDLSELRAMMEAALSAVDPQPTGVQYRIRRPDGEIRWIEGYAIASFEGQGDARHAVSLTGTVADITDRKRSQDRVARVSRLYAILSRVNEAIVRTHDEQTLCAEVCRVIAEETSFAMVSIGEVVGRQLVPRAVAGPASSYFDSVRIETDGPLSVGPSGQAILQERPVIVTDFLVNPASEPWRDVARDRGIRAVAAFPLRRRGRVTGALTLSAFASEVFDAEEVQLLTALAADYSYAVDSLDQERLRREAVEQLRQSEERFRVIAANTPDHLLVQDRDLRYRLVVNPQFGLTEEEMLGKTDHDFLEKEDAERLTALKRNVLATGESVHLEVPLTSRDGERGYFEGHYVARRDASGAVDGLIGYFRNVTERRQAEAAMRRSEEERRIAEAVRAERQRLYDVLETLPAMIALLTPDHHVAFANRGFRDQFGEANGRRCFECCFGRSEPCEFCQTYRVLETGRSHHWEVTTPTGTVIAVHAMPFTDSDGSPMILEMNLDITESRRADNALREAHEHLEKRATQLRALAGELTLSEQRERRRLAGFLHDHLQQLLVAAKWRAAALAQGEDAPARSAAAEIEHLLDSSIADARTLTVELSPPILRPGGVAVDLAWLARWSAERHGLAVELTAEEDLPPLPDDVRMLLFESVRELLFNAAKHAKVRSVDVAVSRTPDPGICITVSDQGAGFDPGEVKKAVEAGGGFGLFSIQERLNLSGGSLGIDSAPGRGSRFTLTVKPKVTPDFAGAVASPTGAAAPRQRAERSDLPTPGPPIRVLLADDHVVVREGLTRLLGHEPDIEIVGQAATGEEAIALAEALRPDVILMDLSMPHVDGIEATRIIHRRQPDVQVIGLSMFDDESHAQEMQHAGVVAYLSKSGPPGELIAAIRNAARRRRTQLSAERR